MNFISESLHLSQEIEKCGYDYAFVVEKLRNGSEEFKELTKERTLINVTASAIGFGFLSNVYKVAFEFSDGKKWSCILKVPSKDRINEGAKQDGTADEMACSAHTNECDFFNLVKNDQDGPAPPTYYIQYGSDKNPGCILMKDFSDTAVTLQRHMSISEQLCINMAKTIAKFQARASTFDPKVVESFNNQQALFNLVGSFLNMARPAVIKDGVKAEYLKKCMCATTIEFTVFSMIDLPKEYGAQVLIHGDLHGNNMLIYKNEDKSLSNRIAAFIDWQTLYEGNPLADIARFMSNVVDGCTRRGLGNKIVDIFYESLVEEYRKLKKEVLFSRETCQIFYDYALLHYTTYMMIQPYIIRHIGSKTETAGLIEAMVKYSVLRANLLLEDAIKLVDKYGIRKKFHANDNFDISIL